MDQNTVGWKFGLSATLDAVRGLLLAARTMLELTEAKVIMLAAVSLWLLRSILTDADAVESPQGVASCKEKVGANTLTVTSTPDAYRDPRLTSLTRQSKGAIGCDRSEVMDDSDVLPWWVASVGSTARNRALGQWNIQPGQIGGNGTKKKKLDWCLAIGDWSWGGGEDPDGWAVVVAGVTDNDVPTNWHWCRWVNDEEWGRKREREREKEKEKEKVEEIDRWRWPTLRKSATWRRRWRLRTSTVGDSGSTSTRSDMRTARCSTNLDMNHEGEPVSE